MTEPAALSIPEPIRPLPEGVQVPAQRSAPLALATSGRDVGAVVTMVGGTLIALSTCLPWITAVIPAIGSLSLSGLELGGDLTGKVGDGPILLVFGAVAVLVGILRLVTGVPVWVQRLVPILLGGLAVLLAVVDLGEVSRRVVTVNAEPAAQAAIGEGLYVLVLAGLVTVAGGLLAKRRGK